jgi:hypothetical protein
MPNTSSRKPGAARAAARPAASRRAAEPDVELEVTAADAQEIEAEGHHVTATLGGVDDREEEVRIIPPGAWRQSWQRLLNTGQVDAFAKIVLHPDDYDLYLELDPTNEQFGEMVGEAAERAGESLGNSRGPAPSSRSMRRR